MVDWRRLYYRILSISPRINPCPSCPHIECKVTKEQKKEVVGCSRWP